MMTASLSGRDCTLRGEDTGALEHAIVMADRATTAEVVALSRVVVNCARRDRMTVSSIVLIGNAARSIMIG
jgi:hypothetical protein